MTRPRDSAKSAEEEPAATALSVLLAEATGRLRDAGLDSPRREAVALAVQCLGLGRESMVAAPNRPLTEPQTRLFREATSRRAAGEPLARITGHREFWSLDFVLSADTLVPRPDTETVVEAVLAEITDSSAVLSILDLGTGSGCILLALLSELANARGTGIDISQAAIETARENMNRLGLHSRAGFQTGNWTDGLSTQFDIVVANPPYIAEADRDALMVEVRDHDPPLALFAGADGLAAFRALISGLAGVLVPGGLVALECGAGQGPKVAEMLALAGFDSARLVADMGGHDRVVVASRKA
jgi:release factor glutamine methyltransferase